MKSIKGLALGAALAGVVFTGAANADAATIGKDVAGTKYEESTTKLAALNITKGFPDGTVRPDENVTRAQTAAFMIRALNYQLSMDQSTTIFSDVAYEHPLSGAIQLASGREIIKGYLDGTFRSEESVTIAQASAILVRMLGYSPAINEADFPNSHLSKAAELGILKNVKADVNAPAKRGDIMLMISNALTVDIMKQDSWGSEQKWAEQEDKNILTEFFDLTVIDTKKDFNEIKGKYEGDMPRVSQTVRTKISSLKADEVEFDGIAGTHTLNEMFNASDFLAQEVQIWIDEDEDYVAYIADSKDQKVVFDQLDKFQNSNKNIKLDNGDDYDILKDAQIYYNLEKPQERDKFNNFKTAGTTMVKVVLDSNEDVVAVVMTDLGKAEYGIVEDVNTGKETINFMDGSSVNNQVKLDGRDFFVVRDGAIATLADIENEDVINAFKNDKNDYYILATSTKVSGEIEDVKYTKEEVSSYDLVIDGKKYDVAAEATFSENKNEDIDEVTTDDLDEMNGVEATLYLDAAGDVQHIVSGELDSTTGNVAVVTKLPVYNAYEDEWKLTIVNELGKEVVYRFEADDIDVYTFKTGDDNKVKKVRGDGEDYFVANNLAAEVDTSDNPVFIEYDIDKNGDLKAITILDAEEEDTSIQLDKYDDSIKIDDATYKVTRNTVFFDVTDAKNAWDGEWDDVDVIAWDALKDKDKGIVDKAFYTIKNNERDLEYMFITDAEGSLTSKGEYGYVTGFSKVGRDDAVRITRIDGEQLTLVYDATVGDLTDKNLDEDYDDAKAAFAKGTFIRYELDSDGEIDAMQILATAGTKGGFYKEKGSNSGLSIDGVNSGEVTKSTASTITLEGKKNVVVNSNTVYIDLIDDGEMEITTGVDTGDFILALDTDDDGVAADFVVIIGEDVVISDPDGDDDAVVGEGAVTYIDANVITVGGKTYKLDATSTLFRNSKNTVVGAVGGTAISGLIAADDKVEVTTVSDNTIVRLDAVKVAKLDAQVTAAVTTPTKTDLDAVTGLTHNAEGDATVAGTTPYFDMYQTEIKGKDIKTFDALQAAINAADAKVKAVADKSTDELAGQGVNTTLGSIVADTATNKEVKDAREAYGDLGEAGKAKVTAENLAKLDAAEKALADAKSALSAEITKAANKFTSENNKLKAIEADDALVASIKLIADPVGAGEPEAYRSLVNALNAARAAAALEAKDVEGDGISAGTINGHTSTLANALKAVTDATADFNSVVAQAREL